MLPKDFTSELGVGPPLSASLSYALIFFSWGLLLSGYYWKYVHMMLAAFIQVQDEQPELIEDAAAVPQALFFWMLDVLQRDTATRSPGDPLALKYFPISARKQIEKLGPPLTIHHFVQKRKEKIYTDM